MCETALGRELEKLGLVIAGVVDITCIWLVLRCGWAVRAGPVTSTGLGLVSKLLNLLRFLSTYWISLRNTVDFRENWISIDNRLNGRMCPFALELSLVEPLMPCLDPDFHCLISRRTKRRHSPFSSNVTSSRDNFNLGSNLAMRPFEQQADMPTPESGLQPCV